MLPASRRAPSLTFIFITLLLDVLGFGLLIPVAPKLVERFMGLREQGQEGQAAIVVAALPAVYAFMQFFFAPILGSLSDRFGRRPVILISLFGSGLDYLAAAAAALWFPHLWVLFITRLINGISGASISACNAYIADVTPPEKRAAGYGVIGAAFGLGFMLGPLAGGVLGDSSVKLPLIGHGDLHIPFVVAGVLTLINWLYGYLVLPESLPPERRRPFSFARSNPFGALVWLTHHRVVIALAASLFLFNLAQFGLHVTWLLSLSSRFGWGPWEVGWSLFVVGICAAVVQGGLARQIIPKLGERFCLIAGMILGILAFVGYGLATHGWMIYAIIAIASIGGVSQPALQAVVTKAVPPTEQGLLQGALAGLNSLAMFGGALLAGAIFAYFTNDATPIRFPGAPFISGALLCLLGLIPVLAIWQRLPTKVAAAPDESPRNSAREA
jgi:MFS transporter, DHA1 family, tetracycline resistance protein